MERGNGAAIAPGAMSRADRFEDEKRRIIDSCFNKKDPDGSLQETYITHIRITEFSSHPSAPPPPQSRSPDSEKPRVIIVAVRKSGRVRMHKTKENANGTFSIGKTWNLDDLTHIQSYTGPTVEPNLRDWAGDTGFLVTIQKSYFWQAQTDKEKKFFIASLIKIYGKYTGGKSPELVGFDQRELEQVSGASKRPPPVRSPLPDSGSQASVSTAASTVAAPSPSTLAPQRSPSQLRRIASPTNGASSPAGSIDSTRSQNQQALRRLAGSNKSQDSVANSFATGRSDDASSLPPRSRSGITGPGAFGRLFDGPTDPVPGSQDERPPERKRPPMDPTRPQGIADRDLVPAPLMSPGMKRDPTLPPRSLDRMSPRKASIDQKSDSNSFRERSLVANGPSRDNSISSMKSPLKGSFSKPPAIPTPTPEQEPPPIEPEMEDSRPGLGPMIKSRRPRADIVPPPEPEEARPGLGPMIRAKRSKGDLAGSLWKAASAASAFMPRPGGAGDRLRQAQNKSEDGPDGITGVVPAPPRPISVHDAPKPSAQEPQMTTERISGIPEVKVTMQPSSRPTSLQQIVKETQKSIDEPPPEAETRSIIVGNDAKYLATLGVDPTILDNVRSAEFTKWLDYVGFVPGDHMRSITWDGVKSDLDREIDKVQAGGWLTRIREEDGRIEGIKRGINIVINECDELDNLLTLYSVELGTIADDIAYIETQSQGLQVQAANQKALKKELELILDTCNISGYHLDALKTQSFQPRRGLGTIEDALVILYKAMIKIDPSLCGYESNKAQTTMLGADLATSLAMDPDMAAELTMDGDQSSRLNSNYGKMRIVQEKKEYYLRESSAVVRRYLDWMPGEFDAAFAETRKALDRALSRRADRDVYQAHRLYLWNYCAVNLYARDVHLDEWNALITIYQDKSSPVFKSSFVGLIEAWKTNAKKTSGDEAELLFTSQAEKQHEGLATTARKLTVKRSQTLARSFRSDSTSKTNTEKSADSRSLPFEIFSGVLNELVPLVEMETNFYIDFFHATTLGGMDFAEFVAAKPAGDQRQPSENAWIGYRRMEPDRDLARRVTRSMEIIFAFLENELQKLVEWVLSSNPIHGVGVLAALEQRMEALGASNQDFLNTTIHRLHGNLEARFKRFVDEQIRAIEETKVKMAKKRRGVIHFFRVFPQFSTAVENILANFYPATSVRGTVNREYDRILKAMFDALKIIARENKGVGVSAGSNDPEDKEALNYHILLIENLSYFIEETGEQEVDVLEDRRREASTEYAKHLEQYLGAVMRRPLGKVLDYLENVEAQLTLKSADKIAAQPSNSKTVFNKILGTYDAKEVRKGIEALRKRVEKHFGDAEEPAGSSRELVDKVTQECEKFYSKVELRIADITAKVYGGDVLFEWPRVEVKNAFAAGR